MLVNHDANSDLALAAPRLQTVPAGKCFLALPVHAAPGEAIWLQRALGQLLPRHEGVLVLLEEDLDRVAGTGEVVATPPATLGTTAHHTMVRWQEVDAVRRRLERSDQIRVQFGAWSHFADATFESLRRQLLAAFGDKTSFRNDVVNQWVSRQRLAPPNGVTARAAREACLREIDSLAIRLRVGELSGHDAEYGRGPEALLASRLYAGCYAADGLTVEQLIGRPAKRVYRRLD
jgi:hypothetical protein